MIKMIELKRLLFMSMAEMANGISGRVIQPKAAIISAVLGILLFIAISKAFGLWGGESV